MTAEQKQAVARLGDCPFYNRQQFEDFQTLLQAVREMGEKCLAKDLVILDYLQTEAGAQWTPEWRNRFQAIVEPSSVAHHSALMDAEERAVDAAISQSGVKEI